MLRPFAGQEGGPVGGAGQAFAVGGAETEEHREAAFTDAGMLFEGEAFLELHLDFGGVVEVADFQGAAARPGDGEGRQLIEPTDLAAFQMLMEGPR